MLDASHPARTTRICVVPVLLAGLVLLTGMATSTSALEVVSGPTLVAAPAAPLVQVLDLETDEPSRLSVWVSDGIDVWERDFGAYQLVHSLPLAPFKTDRDYEVQVTLYDADGNAFAIPDSLFATTAPLPEGFPPLEITINTPENMEPGYTLFPVRNRDDAAQSRTMILDIEGEVVWYAGIRSSDLRQLSNGHLLYIGNNVIREANLKGEIVNIWHAAESGVVPPPGSIPVPTASFHHEVFATQHGTLLVLGREVRLIEDFPTSEEDPDAPPADAMVTGDLILELDPATGEILAEWSLFDLIDPTRIGYLSLNQRSDGSFDWSHANGVIHDPSDNSIIVSIRHQDAAIKFSRATGELQWIMAPPENWAPEFVPFLLDPIGPNFEWKYHEHSPMITANGNLLFFDNGNFRASPFDDPPVPDMDNYSRAVEYSVDEEAMQVSQVWEYGSAAPVILYAPALSDADELPTTGNVLATFGAVTFVDAVATNGAEAWVVEIARGTPDERVFELRVRSDEPGALGFWIYRSERIRDFYPPPVAVTLDADVTSPAEFPEATAVTFTAEASGGTGVYEYQFWVTSPEGTTSVEQDYGGGPTYLWSPAYEGEWLIEVRAKSSDSTALWEASNSVPFQILSLFSDGFESGDLTAWSSSSP